MVALATAGLGQVASELPTGAELAALAQAGGTFTWLADEPDLYSLADGEPMS